ncbi:hypothetical protein [Janthinobacterium fluminis]|uniref:Uncharacterized protein n=1 Tax=Janthinobacterium fluminis TaxID=2987524 RepID=A0ABT5JTW6_9BURK|nr:hypothetical protein [Janthinobacterium fluminis]MDC8756185.1 hypothetical protein [Janthinobacterium fluminis]
MGNSLHNKIYLGRRARAFNSKGVAALFFLGVLACSGLLWIGLRVLG